jgi:hypothetical protein
MHRAASGKDQQLLLRRQRILPPSVSRHGLPPILARRYLETLQALSRAGDELFVRLQIKYANDRLAWIRERDHRRRGEE